MYYVNICDQARNELGILGWWRKVFWEGPRLFKLCPTHFYSGGEAPLAHPLLRAW